MSLSARVARTALDLKHVNRLRVPLYGVRRICLSGGGKASKAYVQATAPEPVQKAKATDDFCFAPENETIDVIYEINDAASLITKATWKLFDRSGAAAIWEKVLKPEEYSHGEHTVKWKGDLLQADGTTLNKPPAFPEGLITVEHSPYKLVLVVEGNADGRGWPLMTWTYFHVLIHELELKLGPKVVLANAADKQVYDTIGNLPAEKSKTKLQVVLPSNLYIRTLGEMYDNSGFVKYKDLWNDGVEIPIFVKPWIRNTAGKKVDVPKAIGAVRFLWNWADIAEDTSGMFKQAKQFVAAAIDYDRKTTSPKGDNCHVDRGGKRGPAAHPIFPARGGIAPADAPPDGQFPFKTELAATRVWSTYSTAWPTGKYVGLSGVIFQPARMGGDAYEVQVHFPHYRKPDGTDLLDDTDDKTLDHAVRKVTGTIEVWRELHIAAYWRKVATQPAINLATVADYYKSAYVKLLDKSGGPQPIANYDAKLRAALTGSTGGVANFGATFQTAVAAGNQGTLTEAMVMVLGYNAFKANVQAAQGFTNPQLATWLTTQNLASAAAYETWAKDNAKTLLKLAFADLLSANDGITVFQFNGMWEMTTGGKSSLNGYGIPSSEFPTIPAGSYSKGAYVQAAPPENYRGTLNNVEQTTTHEIGHLLFLPHAPGAGGADAASHDLPAHWNNCTMSYNYDKVRKFCGFCLLRLRGWDKTPLSSSLAANKRP